MCWVLPKLCVLTHNVRLGYIHVAGEEASVPGGVIGSLDVEHQASHSFQCLNSLLLLCVNTPTMWGYSVYAWHVAA